MRRHPEQLDDIFRPLLDDDETAAPYGAADRDAAKRWFLHQDVPVIVASSLEPAVATSLTVLHAGFQEGELSLADVHGTTSVDDDAVWQDVAGPLAAAGYDPQTGIVTFPDDFSLVVVPGMFVVDRQGTAAEVLAVPGVRAVRVAAGAVLDLSSMSVRGARPDRKAALESLVEGETFQVGVWVHGEAAYLGYLSPIVKYVLYQGRFALEKRGMERVRYSGTGPAFVGEVGPTEQMYSQVITVSANVRQTWVARREGRLYSVDLTVTASQEPGTTFQVLP